MAGSGAATHASASQDTTPPHPRTCSMAVWLRWPGQYKLSRSLFLTSGCLLWLLPTGLHYLLYAVRVPAMSSWMWHLHWWHSLSSRVQLASQTHPSLCLPLLRHLQHCHHPPCHQLQEDKGFQILKSNISKSDSHWLWNHVQVLCKFISPFHGC